MGERTRDLEGRVALVTGGAGGLGAATASALAEAGARVLVSDLSREAAEAVADAIRLSGGHAVGIAHDVSSEDAWAEVVATARREFGEPVTVLHNNAAITVGAVMDKDTDPVHLDLETWNRSLAVTLTGAALGCKHVIPGMLEAEKGSIVNMSSTRGITGGTSRMAYNAAKAGIVSLTRTVAAHYGALGIRCNVIAPGVFETPALGAGYPPQRRLELERSHLLNRFGKPHELAQVVLFLASERSSFVTGAVIPVDGGQTSFSEGLGPAASRGVL